MTKKYFIQVKVAIGFILVLSSLTASAQCVGDITLINGLPLNMGCGGNASQLKWVGAVGGTIINDNSVQWTSSGTFTLKRDYPTGCSNTPQPKSYTISAGPPAPAVSEINAQISCTQAVLNYTGSVYATYWQTSSSGTEETNRLTMTVNQSRDYFVRIKGANGCWSAATTQNVTMPTLPVGGTLGSAPSGNHYGSISRLLTLTGYNGTVKEYRYLENGVETVVPTPSTPYYLDVSFSNPSTTSDLTRTYWAVVQVGSCTTTSSSVSITLTRLPSVSLTICQGQTTSHSITLNTSCQGQSATFAYGSGGQISNADQGSFSVTWQTPGTYTLKRPFNCDMEIVGETVQVLPKPSAPAGAELTQMPGCGKVTLTYTGSGDAFWHTSQNQGDMTYPLTIQALTPKTYYANIKSGNGCWSDDASIVVSTVPAAPVGGTIGSANAGNYYGTMTRTLTLSGYSGTIKEYRYTENGVETVVPAPTSTPYFLNVSFSNNSTTSDLSRTYWAVVQQGSCITTSTSVTLTLTSLPAVSFTVCEGQTTNHTITSNIGCAGDAATFANGSGGQISNGSQPTFSVTWLTPGIYTLKRPFSACDREVAGQTVQVLAKPAAPATGELTQTPGCGKVTLTYSGTATAFWQTSPKQSQTTYPLTMPALSPNTYYANIKAANGCWSDDATIVVSTVPAAPVGGTLSGGGSFYGSISKNLSLSGYSGTILEYKYNENGVINSITTPANNPTFLPINVTLAANGAEVTRDYWAMIRLNGCDVTSQITTVKILQTAPVSVTACVGDVASYSISSSFLSGCSGVTAGSPLFATGVGGSIQNVNGDNFQVTWTSPGVYSFKRSLSSVCGNQYEIMGMTVEVIAPPPAPSVPYMTSNCGSVVLGYSGTPGTNVLWHWQGNNPSGTNTNSAATYTAKFPDTFYLRAIAKGVCWSAQSTSVTIGRDDFAAPVIPIIDYECDAPNISLKTDDATDRWYNSETSTTSIGQTNTITVPNTAMTYFLERKVGTTCKSRVAYAIDQSFDLKCGKQLNSVKVTKPLEAVTDIVASTARMENIMYFDGLGRDIQQVGVQLSPQKKDMVTPIQYDVDGRQPVQYLPYVAATNTGAFQLSPVGSKTTYTSSPQYAFYNQVNSNVATDPSPFAVTIFEPSPLSRVLKQGAPGQVWQPNTQSQTDKTIKKKYELNSTNDVLKIAYDQATGAITLNGTYDANELFANKTLDEHDHEVIEFLNKEGQVLCKKVEVSTVNTTRQYASTYYVYDTYNNLVVVLSPEATRSLQDQ